MLSSVCCDLYNSALTESLLVVGMSFVRGWELSLIYQKEHGIGECCHTRVCYNGWRPEEFAVGRNLPVSSVQEDV